MSSTSFATLLVKTIARFPLPVRRRLLHASWRLSLRFRKDIGFGLEPILERSLRIGSGAARRIAHEHDFHDLMQSMEWFASTIQTDRQMVSDYARTRVSDPDFLERLAASGLPVILAPLHMGIFPLGISYVIWKYFPGRRLLILRAREDVEDNNIAMQRLAAIAGELRIVNTRDETQFLEAMRFARKGAVVICLIDLPASYGAPAETRLFGEPARIALGLDAMARMLKAVVLPMAVKSRLSGEDIMLGQPFEISESSAESRRSLAMEIGAQIERFVAAVPEQWHMWTRLPEFRPSQPSPPFLAEVGTEAAREIVDAVA